MSSPIKYNNILIYSTNDLDNICTIQYNDPIDVLNQHDKKQNLYFDGSVTLLRLRIQVCMCVCVCACVWAHLSVCMCAYVLA